MKRQMLYIIKKYEKNPFNLIKLTQLKVPVFVRKWITQFLYFFFINKPLNLTIFFSTNVLSTI